MAETKICLYTKCRKEFIPYRKGVSYCCPECRYKQNKENARERDKQRSANARKKRAKRKALVDLSKEARKLGMSYGTYVAMMEMKKGMQS